MSAIERPDAAAVASALDFEADRTRSRIHALERDLATLRDATADSPDDEHDPEGATIAFERQQVAALLAAATARLAELEDARTRLRAGDYGQCLDCGTSIPRERLLARPAVRRCATCAARSDP
ncbi:TraR/DksA family transcriptional regulator [Egicoccus sp. AB-alg6-2]|uniref:TraR/DksA family transcriptional regulator n=1 Tax=Egicoccus sp. AB-alg6-2 TaxID=3242692 RepID=UPI00359DA147